MRPLAIIEEKIPTKRGACFTDTSISVQVDLFVFDRTPKTLYKYLIAPRTAAIHADGDTILQ